MRGLSLATDASGNFPLVAGRDRELRGLADDAAGCPETFSGEALEHAAHANAAGLLIMRNGNVQRTRQTGLTKAVSHSQHASDEPLHVRGPACIKPPLPFGQRER